MPHSDVSYGGDPELQVLMGSVRAQMVLRLREDVIMKRHT
jgi:hypothetical protein